jgi:hypothetical protein
MLFMDYNCENKYPVVSFQTLPRIEGLSDHTPILLTTVTLTPPCKRPFKFELAWLHMEGFSDLVKEVWESHVTGRTPSRTGIINCVQRVDFSVDGRDTCLDG